MGCMCLSRVILVISKQERLIALLIAHQKIYRTARSNSGNHPGRCQTRCRCACVLGLTTNNPNNWRDSCVQLLDWTWDSGIQKRHAQSAIHSCLSVKSRLSGEGWRLSRRRCSPWKRYLYTSLRSFLEINMVYRKGGVQTRRHEVNSTPEKDVAVL